MKTLLKTSVSVFLFFTLFSCKKQNTVTAIATQAVNDNSISALSGCNGKWFGIYGSGDYPYDLDTVKDETFIANGIAKLSSTPYSYFYTSINFGKKAESGWLWRATG